MTVKELKKQLAECDDDALVLVRGYEGGQDKVEFVLQGFCSDEDSEAFSWDGAFWFQKRQDGKYKNKAVWLKAGR